MTSRILTVLTLFDYLLNVMIIVLTCVAQIQLLNLLHLFCLHRLWGWVFFFSWKKAMCLTTVGEMKQWGKNWRNMRCFVLLLYYMKFSNETKFEYKFWIISQEFFNFSKIFIFIFLIYLYKTYYFLWLHKYLFLHLIYFESIQQRRSVYVYYYAIYLFSFYLIYCFEFCEYNKTVCWYNKRCGDYGKNL